MTMSNQQSIDAAQNRRITSSTVTALLALLVAIASLGLNLWKHINDTAGSHEHLSLSLAPDFRDYTTRWGIYGPGPAIVDTRWILRVVNMSTRPTAITEINSQSCHTGKYASSITHASLNSAYTTYDGRSIVLPTTLEPSGTIVLVLDIPITMWLDHDGMALTNVVPEDTDALMSRVDAAVMEFTGYDVWGNSLLLFPESSNTVTICGGERKSEQIVRIMVSTARGDTYSAEEYVGGHHTHQPINVLMNPVLDTLLRSNGREYRKESQTNHIEQEAGPYDSPAAGSPSGQP